MTHIKTPVNKAGCQGPEIFLLFFYLKGYISELYIILLFQVQTTQRSY